MAKILSCVNLKGGVGKTAIAVNFAAYCGERGYKTLLIDLDPQTNATFSCVEVAKWEKHSEEKGTISNIIGRRPTSADGTKKSPNDVIIKKVFNGVDLIPAHLDLFTIDLDIAGEAARETKLKRAMNDVVSEYEIVVCDCPPNLTIPTQNALAFSSHYLVPVSPDYLSGIGIGLLLKRVREYCADVDHKLEHVGIVLSRVGRPARFREEITMNIRDSFGDIVLDNEIKERVAVAESASRQCPIFSFGDPSAASEFSAVSREVLTRMGVR